MNKQVFIISSFVFLFWFLAYAQNETLTITTYYPSPQGSYKDLQVTNRLNVGLDRAGGNPNAVGMIVGGADGGAIQIAAHSTTQGPTTRFLRFGNVDNNWVFSPIMSIVNEPAQRVGIGTITPTQTLDVNGDTNISGNLTLSGNFTLTGTSNTCIRQTFTSVSGTQTCPAGYNVPMAPFSPSSTSGVFLCCKFQ